MLQIMYFAHRLGIFLPIICFYLFLFATPLSLQACPACKDNIEQRVDARGTVAGSYAELSSTEKAYSWTVLFLIAIPLGFIGWLARLFMRMHAEEKAKWAHLRV